MDLANRLVLITGAASGLGRAAARHLVLEKGMRAALLDRAFPDPEGLSAELGSDRVALYPCDVTDRASLAEVFARIAAQQGGLQACLNTAGIAGTTRLLPAEGPDALFATFDQTIAVNLTGTLNVMAGAARAMQDNVPDDEGSRGVIINISSVAAQDGSVGHIAYSASKAAVSGMTLPAARELAKYGIRVMAVAPGFFDTEMAHGIKPSALERMTAQILQPKRFGKPSEFAGLISHIIANPYLNAEVIRIDAGVRLS